MVQNQSLSRSRYDGCFEAEFEFQLFQQKPVSIISKTVKSEPKVNSDLAASDALLRTVSSSDLGYCKAL